MIPHMYEWFTAYNSTRPNSYHLQTHSNPVRNVVCLLPSSPVLWIGKLRQKSSLVQESQFRDQFLELILTYFTKLNCLLKIIKQQQLYLDCVLLFIQNFLVCSPFLLWQTIEKRNNFFLLQQDSYLLSIFDKRLICHMK